MRTSLLLLAGLALAACSTVPGTGRKRLAPMMSLEQQLALGKDAYGESHYGPDDDGHTCACKESAHHRDLIHFAASSSCKCASTASASRSRL